MKKLGVTLIIVAFMAAIVSPAVSFADENAAVANKEEVDELTQKVEALERQVQVLNSAPRASTTTYVAPSESAGALQGITISGFVDTQYNANLTNETVNPSVTAGSPGNPLRTFDRNMNTFTVNNIEFDIEKLANPEGGAGFRVDISGGEDQSFIDGGTVAGGGTTSRFGFQQAYVQLVAPLHALDGNEIFGNVVDIRVGRQVTLAGAEVIEGKDNWNISRSFMFGLGIPFTHTGVRAIYKLFQDKLTTYWGANNGWDANVDNNAWKTLEFGAAYNFTDTFSYANAIYLGPEGAQQAGHKRFLLSNVLSWQATDKLAFKGELNFGSQARVAAANGDGFEDGRWWGFALYSRYALTDKWGLSYRWEFFRDKDQIRTVGFSAATLGSDTLWAMTFGSDYKIYENLLGRVEYRYDKSDDLAVFNAEHGQSTLGAQLIYSFA